MSTKKRAAKVVRLQLDTIRPEPAIRARVKTSPTTVTRYAALMDQGVEFEPVVVFRDVDGVLWLGDGVHRLAAARRANRTEIAAEVRDGSERDAFLFAAGANLEHGLVSRPADRKQVAAALLADP